MRRRKGAGRWKDEDEQRKEKRSERDGKVKRDENGPILAWGASILHPWIEYECARRWVGSLAIGDLTFSSKQQRGSDST